MKTLLTMTVQGLSVVCQERGDTYYIEARGFGWVISRHFNAPDWRPVFYEFIEKLLSIDFAHLNRHPDDPYNGEGHA